MSEPTIKDVAHLAGVSVATVSRVMNNRGYLSQKTKNIVFDAMQTLDYTPNQLARNLFRKKTFTIGLLIPDIRHQFFSDITYAIEKLLTQNSYKLMICNTNGKTNKERDYITMLRQSKVDGIIIGSHALNTDEYNKITLPIVSFDMALSPNILLINSDHQQGGLLAAQELIKSKCKNVIQFTGNAKVATPSLQRYTTFKTELQNNGIKCTTLTMADKEFALDEYYDIVHTAIKKHKPDGIFCSDILAIHCIKACATLNRTIPEDVCIVGYDNTYWAKASTPRLTVIQQDIQALAQNITDNLFALIANKKPVSNTITIGVSLIKGQTTRSE
ncbi:MAG: LacI family DNA-binding transcriptional regulator [Treponemataceae bacterium]